MFDIESSVCGKGLGELVMPLSSNSSVAIFYSHILALNANDGNFNVM